MKKMIIPAHESRIIEHVPGAAVLSGAVVLIAGGVGFANDAIASGKKGGVVIGGQHGVTKITGVTIVAGEKAYYITATDNFTNVAGGNTLAGFWLAAQASGDLVGRIYLFEPPGA